MPMPKTVFSGTAIATITQRQPERVLGLGRGDAPPRRRRARARTCGRRPSPTGQHEQRAPGSRARRRAAPYATLSAHGAPPASRPARSPAAARTRARAARRETAAAPAALSVSICPKMKTGRDLGLEREVAGDQHDRAELARARGRSARPAPASDRRAQVGQDDPAEDRARARAERRGGLLHLAVELDAARAAPSARRTAASRTAARAATPTRVKAMSIADRRPSARRARAA